ncbi:unnamed protein product [Moneuplotes crassus]|uniref:Uncharacterized protein n=1 Tax=Euplotes crassus TaxID=5936 RepID=A0AAD1X7G2_EUPCR|nr:unnamed protein product [Moneuplotes crassus]
MNVSSQRKPTDVTKDSKIPKKPSKYASSPRILNIDQMITEAGEFGNWSWAVLLVGLIFCQGTTMYFYTLPLLELVPKLECKQGNQWIECSRQDICRDQELIGSELWRVDYADEFSFRNWITELQLYCYPDFWIGFLGSAHFVGVIFNGLILKHSDYFGSKKMLTITSVGQAICCFSLFYCTNITLIYIILFISGLLYCKSYLAYIYCVEVTPLKYQVFYGGFVLSMEAVFSKFLIIPYLYYSNPGNPPLHSLSITLSIQTL